MKLKDLARFVRAGRRSRTALIALGVAFALDKFDVAKVGPEELEPFVAQALDWVQVVSVWVAGLAAVVKGERIEAKLDNGSAE